MANLRWLDGYSGQTVEELLALASDYRTDSLVVVLEEAIGQKAARLGEQSLSGEERLVLAVEALEREVNNGGYRQFFLNSSKEFAPMIVDSLRRIGCPKTAAITSDAIEAALAGDDRERDERLRRCDENYYQSAEDIASRLFEFVRRNKSAINLAP
jgi:hypothetical protein